MSSSAKQIQQEKLPLFLSHLYHWFFAACIVLGTATTFVSVIANPGYYRVGNGEITAFIAAFAASSDFMGQTHVISTVIAAYLLPLGLLAMAWMALPRSPWWTSCAILVLLIGLLPLAAFGAEDSLSYDFARISSAPLLLNAAFRFDHDGPMTYYKAMFIIGTIPGIMLLGIALWRARVVPVWAAILIIISRPIAFLFPFLPVQLGIIVQLPSFLLLFIGSIPAALVILKTRAEQTLSPPNTPGMPRYTANR
jgi:hypothetical protein